MSETLADLHRRFDGPIPDHLRDKAMGNMTTDKERQIRDLQRLADQCQDTIERMTVSKNWYLQAIEKIKFGECYE